MLLLAPFEPFMAEELWQHLGGDYSVHQQPWPTVAARAADSVHVIVQVDGKRRGRVSVPTGAGTDTVVESATAAVAAWLRGREVERVVNVPGRLVNFVTTERDR